MSLPDPGLALLVQPHYDDVPPSCGGTVARLVERGDCPAIVTVLASELVEEMWASSPPGSTRAGG